LAGGFGTRLRSVIGEIPKPIAKVNGRPFLSYIFDQLINSGFNSAIICIGYNGNLIRELFGSHYKSLELIYSQENEPLGTAGALRLMMNEVSATRILVLNGDSYCGINLNKFIHDIDKAGKKNGIALTWVANANRYGQVKVNNSNHVVEFLEKNNTNESSLINVGIYLFRTQIFEKLPESKEISLEREVLPNLIHDGLYAYVCNEEFIDIGVPESYMEAGNFFNKL
jgi:D-glycero-alpha-D-manno-heptose 1-phosphate guanylyltransferase